MPVAGVIIITASGMERGSISGWGIIFLLLTMLASAFYKTANRSAAKEFTSFERTLMILSASAVTFTILGMQSVDWNISAFVAPFSSGKYTTCVLCLSLLCSIAANLLVNYASGKMSVFKVASFGSLSTLCSTVLGVVILKEDAGIALLIGAAMIMIGIRQVTKPQPKA
jgi:drug/metabolite transporter (DMT)-like permease